MKKVLVLHTGGTISMTQEDGGVSLSNKHPLGDKFLPLPKDIELIVEETFNLPSPHITPKEMLVLKNRIVRAQTEDFVGVVITHGTDTLEETAYFLELTLKNNLAMVLTGAMRSSNEIGSDGLYNFRQAIITASHESARDKGVLVVMNDEIHEARFVTKTHTTSVDTFRAPTFGPIGILSKNKPIFLKDVMEEKVYDIQTTDGIIPIVKAYAGMDRTMFDLLLEANVDGVIIEALGAGNLPPAVLTSLEKLLNKNIPVALVSRCSNGIAEDIYSYIGGGVELKKMGVMFVRGITGPKARLRLLVGLNAKLDLQELKKYMSEI
ncbi:asparaginase [Vagococcus sp. JNUCC 83]